MSNENKNDTLEVSYSDTTQFANERESFGEALISIIRWGAVFFMVSIFYWLAFSIIPDYAGTGTISLMRMQRDILVYLGACFSLSTLGYICYSTRLMAKVPLILRILIFTVIGFGILTAFIIGSGMCPMSAFSSFAMSSAWAFIGVDIYIFMLFKRNDKMLQNNLKVYKNSKVTEK